MKHIIEKGLFAILLFSFMFFSTASADTYLGNDYDPNISSNDFTSVIEGNPYFHLPVGTVLEFREETPDGIENITIEILDETVDVNGIETRVYLDTVYFDGQIVEQTRDYIAQHKKTGDVWYFGEDVNNYENGKLADHDGAWLYGKDGALPGIWVKADPQVGDVYLQEYLEGEAEDTVEVLSLSENVNVGGKSYTNCLKTYDYTPLDKKAKEHKYYCKEVGNLVFVKHLVDGGTLTLVSAQKESGVKKMKEDKSSASSFADVSNETYSKPQTQEIKSSQNTFLWVLLGGVIAILFAFGLMKALRK